MCEIYWKKPNTVSDPPPFLGGQWPVPNFEMGLEKIECLGELKESIPQIFARGLTVFLVKKDYKVKYGFEDSISNVDLSSAAN